MSSNTINNLDNNTINNNNNNINNNYNNNNNNYNNNALIMNNINQGGINSDLSNYQDPIQSRQYKSE